MSPAKELLKLFIVLPEFNDSVPRIRDLALARRLDVRNPQAFAEVVEEIEEDDPLEGAYRRTVDGQVQRWFTEENALLIAFEVDTPAAKAVVREVIHTITTKVPRRAVIDFVGADSDVGKVLTLFEEMEQAK